MPKVKKKLAETAVELTPPTVMADPNPVLMSALLQAKGALMEAQTPQAYVMIKKIMELEVNLTAKTLLTASALQAAKTLSVRQQAGNSVHPEEVYDLLTRFYLL